MLLQQAEERYLLLLSSQKRKLMKIHQIIPAVQCLASLQVDWTWLGYLVMLQCAEGCGKGDVDKIVRLVRLKTSGGGSGVFQGV